MRRMGCSTIETTYFPMFISAAVSNALGIVLFVKDTNCKTNQNLILKYLSAVEFGLACFLTIYLSFICHGQINGSIDIQLLLPVIRCSFLDITLIMWIMTLDRIIATKYPIRYANMMTSKTVKVILFFTTLFCILLGVLLSVLEARKFIVIYYVNISCSSRSFRISYRPFIHIHLLTHFTKKKIVRFITKCSNNKICGE